MALAALLLAASLALQSPAQDSVRAAVEAAVRESADASDFAETPAYRELVAALLELKPPDVEARAPAPLDAARALAEPALLRGTWVRARGSVMLQHDVVLDPPIGTAKKLVRTIVRLERPRGSEPERGAGAPGAPAVPDVVIACDLIGDPPPYKTRTDTVELSGVFFRTVLYTSVNGNQVALPYVLARSMELVDTPGSALGKSLLGGGLKLLGGIALGLVGVIVFVMYLRRSARAD